MKKKILNKLKETISMEKSKLKKAQQSAKDMAIDSDLKQESKWDTRALEASYLSSGYDKRLSELQQELQILDEVDVNLSDHSSTVTIGSLIKLQLNERIQNYFLSPTSGGTTVLIDGMAILVISIFSPIGAHVMDLSEGEEFDIEINGNKRLYKIISIL